MPSTSVLPIQTLETQEIPEKWSVSKLLRVLPRVVHYQKISDGHGSPDDIIQAAAAYLRGLGLHDELTNSLSPVFAALRQYQNDHGTARLNATLGVVPAGFAPPLVTGKGERQLIFYPEESDTPRKITMRHELNLAVHVPQGAGQQLSGVFPRQKQRGLVLQIARPAHSDSAQMRMAANGELKNTADADNAMPTLDELIQELADAEWQDDPRLAQLLSDPRHRLEFDLLLRSANDKDFSAETLALLTRIGQEKLTIDLSANNQPTADLEQTKPKAKPELKLRPSNDADSSTQTPAATILAQLAQIDKNNDGITRPRRGRAQTILTDKKPDEKAEALNRPITPEERAELLGALAKSIAKETDSARRLELNAVMKEITDGQKLLPDLRDDPRLKNIPDITQMIDALENRRATPAVTPQAPDQLLEHTLDRAIERLEAKAAADPESAALRETLLAGREALQQGSNNPDAFLKIAAALEIGMQKGDPELRQNLAAIETLRDTIIATEPGAPIPSPALRLIADEIKSALPEQRELLNAVLNGDGAAALRETGEMTLKVIAAAIEKVTLPADGQAVNPKTAALNETLQLRLTELQRDGIVEPAALKEIISALKDHPQLSGDVDLRRRLSDVQELQTIVAEHFTNKQTAEPLIGLGLKPGKEPTSEPHAVEPAELKAQAAILKISLSLADHAPDIQQQLSVVKTLLADVDRVIVPQSAANINPSETQTAPKTSAAQPPNLTNIQGDASFIIRDQANLSSPRATALETPTPEAPKQNSFMAVRQEFKSVQSLEQLERYLRDNSLNAEERAYLLREQVKFSGGTVNIQPSFAVQPSANENKSLRPSAETAPRPEFYASPVAQPTTAASNSSAWQAEKQIVHAEKTQSLTQEQATPSPQTPAQSGISQIYEKLPPFGMPLTEAINHTPHQSSTATGWTVSPDTPAPAAPPAPQSVDRSAEQNSQTNHNPSAQTEALGKMADNPTPPATPNFVEINKTRESSDPRPADQVPEDRKRNDAPPPEQPVTPKQPEPAPQPVQEPLLRQNEESVYQPSDLDRPIEKKVENDPIRKICPGTGQPTDCTGNCADCAINGSEAVNATRVTGVPVSSTHSAVDLNATSAENSNDKPANPSPYESVPVNKTNKKVCPGTGQPTDCTGNCADCAINQGNAVNAANVAVNAKSKRSAVPL